MHRNIFYAVSLLILLIAIVKSQNEEILEIYEPENNAKQLFEVSDQGHENIGDRESRGLGGLGGYGGGGGLYGGGLYGGGFGGGFGGGGLRYKQKIVIKKRGFAGGFGGFKGGFGGGVGGLGGLGGLGGGFLG